MAVALATIAFSGGVVAAVSVWGLMAALTTIAGAMCLNQILRRFIASNSGSTNVARGERGDIGREFWRFAAPRATVQLLDVILLWVDVILLEVLRGPTQAGVYSAAIRYLALGTLALSAAVLVVAPQVSEFFARRETSRVAAVYKTSTLWLCIISLPIVFTTAVSSPTFMTAFGREFSNGAPALTILSLAMAVNVACGPVNTILLMGGGSLLNLANVTVAVILNVVLNLILVPQYGFNGSAVAWTIAIVITNLMPLVQVHHLWRIHPGSWGLLAVSALAIGAYGGLGLVVRARLGTAIPVAATTIVVSSGFYGVGLWKTRRITQLEVLGGVVRGAARQLKPGVSR